MATALITGGTSGIGAQFARSLAARGFDLVLVARDSARLDAMAATLHADSGIQVEVLSADLSKRADVDRVAARLEDAEHPIEYLVNNAGFGVHTKLLDRDTTAHELAFDVMGLAVLLLGGAAGRAMRERGHGTILNVSSTAGFITMGSYSAIKAWVTSYTEGLAVELRGTGVHVTALCPGWVRTEFHKRAGIRVGSIPGPLWIDVEPLVETALRDAERGTVISIPTVRFKALMWFARHAPKSAIRRVSAAISSSRSSSNTDATHPVAPSGPNSTGPSTTVGTTGEGH
ncbi:SDR family NAD(P)-dependent oxidoreductase [Lacisediminihabitans changchengi]|uniref:SDR family NAD(P)-dependent oxidoreductase n=1 Tax=Lacisediminihabitans changchengi TaxID=2787634 RepID=A0A934W276_9MICO|nr:SDR family NAD(P)-dependent oxidoreductase [Lacisediminihabitans changchengi]MBK4346546.1 SDR family NAD(P)-dependent oxidoreductase [Lacisediminihabitans changchengi]